MLLAAARTKSILDLRIREAVISDLPRIMVIEEIAFEHPWSRESFTREFALPFSKTWVAVHKDPTSIVGYLCRWLVTDECHILNVAVDPDFRCTGIGTILISEAIAEASMKRAAMITLEVRRSNLAARSLYRKLQFEERRLRKNYYGVGEDAIIMERQLA